MTYTTHEECGGHFPAPHGFLTSPSYPENYPNGADCTYIISQPNGTYVNMTILDLDLEFTVDLFFGFGGCKATPKTAARGPGRYFRKTEQKHECKGGNANDDTETNGHETNGGTADNDMENTAYNESIESTERDESTSRCAQCPHGYRC